MTTPISFHLFPFLPLELQMQIWREAAEPLGLWQLACVSFVHIPIEGGISDFLGGIYMSMGWDGEGWTELLLSTCRTSRRIQLEMWKKDAENINADEWHHPEVFAGLFWDDDVDGNTWEDAQLRHDALPITSRR